MSKLSSALAVAAAALALSSLAAAPAQALVALTFVSGKGVDSGACAAPATPCRTFQYAHNQTSAGGEIKALHPAQYGSFVITKSISVTGVEGAGVTRPAGGDAITINAGANGVVSLSNLTIDGFNRTASNGIRSNSAASLTIRNCTARNFSTDGIRLIPTTAPLKFLIADVVAADNGGVGVYVVPQNVSAQGVLNHVSAKKNSLGIVTDTIAGAADVTAVDSVASDNANEGFFVSPGTSLRLTHSTATRNRIGVAVFGTASSAGDNFISGNTTADVNGVLTNVGTK